MNSKLMATQHSTIAEGDMELTQQVAQSIVAQRRALRSVSVQAECGTVTLAGTVNSFHLKQLAVVLTRYVPGVVRVVDNVEVDQGADRAPAEATGGACLKGGR